MFTYNKKVEKEYLLALLRNSTESESVYLPLISNGEDLLSIADELETEKYLKSKIVDSITLEGKNRSARQYWITRRGEEFLKNGVYSGQNAKEKEAEYKEKIKTDLTIESLKNHHLKYWVGTIITLLSLVLAWLKYCQ